MNRELKSEIWIKIKVPQQHAKLLALWAKNKGTNRTTLAGNIVQAKVEANEPQILEWIARGAEDSGMGTEEFKQMVYEEAGLYTGSSDDE